MNDKEQAQFDALLLENAQLRLALRDARIFVAAPQQYMSGRWHRRDGNVYGISINPQEVADADSPPRNLRPTYQR